ncbi:G protein-coupled glucose receptor regulating Gpa2-domain-containing protein [Dactylonectria estremocensis]|uniref:G protein-coupled glucose receptor regulating Gpa2-domain-containing protein n=1 Tax=Dactylonectria estremocensis TaxID=1079267 RepID=A0A9P9FB70_9HYPO|nr:G protein-coupled glucose receptor regulating Gpa2-domain-containing protein [Dactylonectria estremocensis]
MSSYLPPDWLTPGSIKWSGDGSTYDTRSNEKLPVLSQQQTYALHIASVAGASLSIIAGMVAMFWFVRMKRSFRHDLVMILIGSDMFKATWFLLFPTVELIQGKVSSDSIFCNISGFFLVLSMNASDLVVALITLHTALYVFRGDQGLYPFRKYAFPVILIVPTLLASMAFLNKIAYMNTGQFCWLPVNPMWTRLLLSWVPRYFIFAAIIGLSLTIYIYVRVVMKGFETGKGDQRGQPARGENLSVPSRATTSVMTTPIIPYTANNTQTTVSSRRNSGDDRIRHYSSSTMSTLHVDARHYISKLARWSYQSTKSKTTQTEIDENLPPHQERLGSYPDTQSITVVQEATLPSGTHTRDSSLSPTFYKAPVTLLQPNDTLGVIGARSAPSATALGSHPPLHPHTFAVLSLGTSSRGSDSENPILEEPTLDNTGMVKTRETIRKQLRLVLIYPFAYMVVWIVPFIVHLTNYDKGAPFPMRVVSISCLCLHGFVDALIFSLKEKPWLHIRRRKRGAFSRCWTRRDNRDGMQTNAGRTREEMLIDGRNAKERRDREMADRQQEPQTSRNRPTEWWDQDE